MKPETKSSKPKEPTSSSEKEEIKSDMPISEKDEEKSAERRMREKALKDNQ